MLSGEPRLISGTLPCVSLILYQLQMYGFGQTTRGRKPMLPRPCSRCPTATTLLSLMFTTTTCKVCQRHLRSMITPLKFHLSRADLNDKSWAWNNYLSPRALAQADNVRNQIKRVMEKQDIDLVSTTDQSLFYLNVRKALICGFFMQVAHKEGEKGNYLTVKDNQVGVTIVTTRGTAHTDLTSRSRLSPFIHHAA
jgi:hypothetical protein